MGLPTGLTILYYSTNTPLYTTNTLLYSYTIHGTSYQSDETFHYSTNTLLILYYTSLYTGLPTRAILYYYTNYSLLILYFTPLHYTRDFLPEQ